MITFDVSLETANKFYTCGWYASIAGAVLTAFGVFFLMWGTRVRDHDFGLRMANLNSEAGQARERAGKLEQSAALLRFELDREVQKRAPRTLTDEQKAIMGKELRGKIPQINIVVQRDVEAEAYSLQFLMVLQDAGAVIHPYKMPPGTMLPAPAGVLMYRPGGAKSEDEMKDDPLYLALKKAGLFGGFMGIPLLSPELGPLGPLPDQYILYVGQNPVVITP